MFNTWMIPRRLLVAMTLGVLAGCGESTPVEPARNQMVYFDTATKKPLVHDVEISFPAKHPTTGKPTLRPALYCPTCQQWYPVPPPDQINRIPGAGRCSKDKTLLTADGPQPTETTPAK
ncbi:MAG: hypothetical protein IAG10_31490 [Planctomycetaceae bacterium]|nr:hypothetical protein [Planctomycetaceae bacterium]